MEATISLSKVHQFHNNPSPNPKNNLTKNYSKEGTYLKNHGTYHAKAIYDDEHRDLTSYIND